MADDDSTPQIRPIEEGDPEAARSDDPAIYLRQPPTPDEHNLSELVGLHNGASVPWWMFAKVALRDYRKARWIAERAKMERKIRRYVRWAFATLAANILAIGTFLVTRHDAAVRLEERATSGEQRQVEQNLAREREIRDLKEDIRELRSMLRRLGGVEPPTAPFPNSDSDQYRAHDKVSVLPQGDDDASTPASVAGSSGDVAEHFPNEQNLHLPRMSPPHWTFELQVAPQLNGTIDTGDGAGAGVPQDSKEKQTMKRMAVVYHTQRRSGDRHAQAQVTDTAGMSSAVNQGDR